MVIQPLYLFVGEKRSKKVKKIVDTVNISCYYKNPPRKRQAVRWKRKIKKLLTNESTSGIIIKLIATNKQSTKNNKKSC